MESNQRTYQVAVEEFYVDRKDLSPVQRIAAAVKGRWPKILLHKIKCPCCGKEKCHRVVMSKNHGKESDAWKTRQAPA